MFTCLLLFSFWWQLDHLTTYPHVRDYLKFMLFEHSQPKGIKTLYVSVLSTYEIQNIWAFWKDNFKIWGFASSSNTRPFTTPQSIFKNAILNSLCSGYKGYSFLFMISIPFGNDVYLKQLSWFIFGGQRQVHISKLCILYMSNNFYKHEEKSLY